ncbi:MAG: hypothetical protein ABS96_30325 [Lysobacteraceae bacterium SCN 69-123]|uniref:hypothetical protein n=1 Tax=Stenotrophomonas acidaminiphila TaxID=128780 RepID=UPI00086E3EDB|nr:hypothetical protein [Stenotrophomonas acidaminiphila]MBN8800438.1 hypothetical protein [Stenotrophomonas acidaminiphila]MDF9442010.1 hypothetical protein [Stenotrophomonas acidaminiphila]ODU41683.1 MAG: hypothetical protein ABS96_30325 [Xanthomonadaceae bacterium SCN 69-123]OJY77772.1 MAG: hypothetical protein BGP18_05975 [Stenotrophomonas sp. 69-14]
MTDQPTHDDDQAQPDYGTFLCARFAGGRFDSHAIPFDVLPDLAAYRSLLVEVAKMLFKRRHNNRVRVPKGFEDSFQIGLVRVEGGHSAVAVGVRLPPRQPAPQGDLGFPAYEEFEEAKTYVDDLIRRVQTTGEIPDDFPTELAGRFNPFGQSLQPDEYIELGYDTPNPVRYDTFIRKRIVLSREKTYENAVNAVFTLNGGVANTGTIHVLDETGSPFDFRPLSEFEFQKAYTRPTQRVRLIGTGLYDRSERLRRLLDVSIVYNDDEPRQPFDERLDEIALAQESWYAPGNPAPSQAAVEAMRNFVRLAVLEVGAHAPYLYPLPEGGVAAEWTMGAWEASANIAPEGASIELHAINTESMQELRDELAADAVDLTARFSTFWDAITTDTGNGDAGSCGQ